jgi:ribonuclease BN (tRNA processing enzyme)
VSKSYGTIAGKTVKITFLGTGDAFGHGSRMQPCILVEAKDCTFLMDCGATAMVSMNRYGVNPNAIDLILISHLHGDHFGGIPFYILDAQLHSKRQRPLVVAGPPGIRRRLDAAMEVMFPGSSKVQRKFTMEVLELLPGEPYRFRTLTVTPVVVDHASGDPALAFRVDCEGKRVAYTGDTAWTEAIREIALDANLLIAEAYFYEKPIKYHLSYRTLVEHLGGMNPGRVLLTHMSGDMLSRLDDVKAEVAEDGMVVEL